MPEEIPTAGGLGGVRDESWADDLDGGTFVSFEDGVALTLEFQEDTPRKRNNQWDKNVWDWDVLQLDEEGHEVDRLVLSTASKRLRRKLGQHRPLYKKRLRIQRSGEGMTTIYKVVEVSRDGSAKLV